MSKKNLFNRVRVIKGWNGWPTGYVCVCGHKRHLTIRIIQKWKDPAIDACPKCGQRYAMKKWKPRRIK